MFCVEFREVAPWPGERTIGYLPKRTRLLGLNEVDARHTFPTITSVMSRPKKLASQRKSVDLRIPVTESQKRVVFKAADLAGEDMARWAREILVKAAERACEKSMGARRK